MAEINIPNFENTPLSFVQLDPGTYTVQIQDPYEQKFENDKEFIQLELTVKAGPAQKQPDEHGSTDPSGRKIRDRIYLTGNAAWRLKRLLVCSGLLARDDKSSAMAKGNINLDLLMASGPFQIKLTPNIKDGKEYRNVEYVV